MLFKSRRCWRGLGVDCKIGMEEGRQFMRNKLAFLFCRDLETRLFVQSS